MWILLYQNIARIILFRKFDLILIFVYGYSILPHMGWPITRVVFCCIIKYRCFLVSGRLTNYCQIDDESSGFKNISTKWSYHENFTVSAFNAWSLLWKALLWKNVGPPYYNKLLLIICLIQYNLFLITYSFKNIDRRKASSFSVRRNKVKCWKINKKKKINNKIDWNCLSIKPLIIFLSKYQRWKKSLVK